MESVSYVDADSVESFTPTLPSPFEGRVLNGTYRVLRQIGQGAMGVVYEAQHLRLYRQVAVKALPAQMAARPELRARFEHEADLVSRIRSRHVVDILDYDVTPLGEPYLVLELLEGESLAARLAREPRLSIAESVRLVRQIALGLSAAHRAGVVHRDLKPDNVFLVSDADEGWIVKLLDFGIGQSLGQDPHITQERMIVGTPDYMAPEQAVGHRHEITSRTDQHALAVLAYEILTGKSPFASEDLGDTLRAIIGAPPPRISALDPALPTLLDPVLARALSKSPTERFSHVADFAVAFSGALEGVERAPFSGDFDPHGANKERARSELLHAKTAFAVDAVTEATRHASVAYDLLEGRELEPQTSALLEVIFGAHVRLSSGALAMVSGVANAAEMSPRTAFLLSRLEQGMRISSILDIAAMPKLEVLRRLTELIDRGDVRVA